MLAVVVDALGWRRFRSLPRNADDDELRRDSRLSRVVGIGAFVAVLVLLAHAMRTFAVRPLVEWDGWAIWGMKARALYDYGGVGHGLFTTQPYGPLQHPLLLPSLEANGLSRDGRVRRDADPRAARAARVRVRGGALDAAARARSRGASRARRSSRSSRPTRRCGSSQETSRTSRSRSSSRSASSRSHARCSTRAQGFLPFAAVMLGAATLTKPEGLLFAAAALVPFVAIARSKASLLTALAVALILLPWRIFTAIHGLKNPEYSLGDAINPGYLADHSSRARPAFWGVWHQVWSSGWGWLVPLALVALVSVLLARRWRLAGFAAAWALLSYAGIVLVFWISVVPVELTLRWAAYRTVASLVIGAAALAPLLAAEAWSVRETRVGDVSGLLLAPRRDQA